MNIIISEETAIFLIKIGLWVGVVTDGLAIIPMLSRRVGVRLFGGDLSKNSHDYRYAMGMGASLMAGWTLLLYWGTGDPLERRTVLLLTVFPVIAGIILSLIFAVRHRIISRSRVIPIWIHLGILSLYYVAVYVISIPFGS